MTQSPWFLILAILAVGMFFVVLPVALTTFSQYRRKFTVICPETGCPAEIGVDAGRATRGAVFGRLSLRAQTCSLWPERGGCEQGCLRSPEPAQLQA